MAFAMILIRLFCLLLLVRVSHAQVIISKLDEDPVFTSVLLRRIKYPIDAERSGIYAKIYVGLDIDQKGHVHNVHILNPAKIGYGFEEEVVKKIKLLPPLNVRYEGNYALPVAFALVDYTNGAKLISPSGQLSNSYFNDRILLKEIKIVGRKLLVQRGNELAPYRAGKTSTINQ